MSKDSGHIVLLGDSIFDNQRYVPGEPDVVAQLGTRLPGGWRASLLAVDGATARSTASQLHRLPADATHMVLSAGGNDALGGAHILAASVRSVAEALTRLAEAQQAFARDYEALIDRLVERGLPTALCTIYDTPSWTSDHVVVRTGLALFNDVITRAAFGRGLPLIDLRLICNEDEDYANPIEPSARGGDKIAQAIAAMTGRDWDHAWVMARTR